MLRLLALPVLASALVCPNVDKDALKANLKQEGEACGGACDSLGWCADGLQCVVPKTSPLSFAILLTPARSGVCRGPVEEATPVEETTDSPPALAGGIRNAEVDEDVLAAASYFIESMNRASNSLTPATLGRVVSVKKQVVAGIKYHIVVEMSDGHQHEFEIVDQAWMTPRYSIVSSKYNIEA